MATVVTLRKGAAKESVIDVDDVLPLGEPRQDKKNFWDKKVRQDPDAIATQPSVYDNPQLAEQYRPRDDWENIHRFNPKARWTWIEEDKIIRKIDLKIMLWVCVMFIGLQIDRANFSQALSDNLLGDLGLNTNDMNLGSTLFALSFLVAELPSQLISKWLGPDRWMPTQLCLWSIVAASQFALSGKASYFTTRILLGLIQGGFIPDVILYLSYFYKHSELSFRLGLFWLAMTIADVLVALLAAGFLQMRGVLGHAGWRWMFLMEGLLTLLIGLVSFFLLPAGPAQTAGNLRGKKGWFSAREEEIMVNRIIRDDPSKGDMHNRQHLTLKAVWTSLCDYHLWPLYLIGLTYGVPNQPPYGYLTLSLRTLGFNTLHTNLLVIPSQVLKTFTMLLWIYLAENSGELLFWASLAQVWCLPFLIWLRVVNITEENPWLVWSMLTVLISEPYIHPLQVSLTSRNSNSVRSRTVSTALYNMSGQLGAIIGMNIYREEDRPLYKVGNTVLIAFVGYNLLVYAGARYFYKWLNAKRDKEWNAMSEEEQIVYLQGAKDGASKRKDFRFAY